MENKRQLERNKETKKQRRNSIKELSKTTEWRRKTYFSIEETASYLNVSIQTLASWRMKLDSKSRQNDTFIPFSKIGKVILYKRADIDNLLNSGGIYIQTPAQLNTNK